LKKASGRISQKNRMTFTVHIYINRNFTMIEKKIEAVHLIKSYDGEGMKYPEVSRIKYLVVPKYGTKYQKVRPNINLIYFL